MSNNPMAYAPGPAARDVAEIYQDARDAGDEQTARLCTEIVRLKSELDGVRREPLPSVPPDDPTVAIPVTVARRVVALLRARELEFTSPDKRRFAIGFWRQHVLVALEEAGYF